MTEIDEWYCYRDSDQDELRSEYEFLKEVVAGETALTFTYEQMEAFRKEVARLDEYFNTVV